ncbi:hypothetical protein C9890_0330 [Perkinsus sp. BL_2016]|nr:hypothetical protein C9890_0330 [Perkinsus sp. BL_2016]
MSINGKRKSRVFSGYKSEDNPAKINKEMPNISLFKHELIESIDAAKSGDKLLAAKPVSSNEEIPEGSVRCFIAQGRQSTLELVIQRVEKIDRELKGQIQELQGQNQELHGQIQELQGKNQELQGKNQELKDINEKMLVCQLTNDMVQLVYGVGHAKMMLMFKDEAIVKGKRVIYINEVLKEANEEQKLRLKKDTTVKSLEKIMNHDFRLLVESRNSEVHPRTIDIKWIEKRISLLSSGSGNFLSPAEKKNVLIADKILEKIQQIDELKEYGSLQFDLIIYEILFSTLVSQPRAISYLKFDQPIGSVMVMSVCASASSNAQLYDATTMTACTADYL